MCRGGRDDGERTEGRSRASVTACGYPPATAPWSLVAVASLPIRAASAQARRAVGLRATPTSHEGVPDFRLASPLCTLPQCPLCCAGVRARGQRHQLNEGRCSVMQISRSALGRLCPRRTLPPSLQLCPLAPGRCYIDPPQRRSAARPPLRPSPISLADVADVATSPRRHAVAGERHGGACIMQSGVSSHWSTSPPAAGPRSGRPPSAAPCALRPAPAGCRTARAGRLRSPRRPRHASSMLRPKRRAPVASGQWQAEECAILGTLQVLARGPACARHVDACELVRWCAGEASDGVS